MTYIKRALVIAGGAALSVAGPGTAHAADTTTTFTLEGGGLALTAPAAADLGTAATSAATVSGSLGTVEVTDARGNLVANWTATVSATDFTTGAGSANETIAKSSVNYLTGPVTASVGLVVTPLLSLTGLGTPAPAAIGVGVGNNSASWNPTVTVSLPVAGAVVGDYTGTITHSVS